MKIFLLILACLAFAINTYPTADDIIPYIQVDVYHQFNKFVKIKNINDFKKTNSKQGIPQYTFNINVEIANE
jgi:hypothetical protein